MQITDDIVDDFVLLFRGRGDCYGSWEGGCVREPLTVTRFEQHLNGTELIGVYPAFNYHDTTVCVWGCTDIDYDNIEHPLAIQAALAAKRVTTWLEKTRKGWHLWCFASELVAAQDMRRMFLAAHQVVDVPAKEVNPKQERLTVSQVGNYVRLPYPGGLEERRIWRDGEQLPLDIFLQEATTHTTPKHVIEELATYWRPPAHEIQMTSPPSHDMTVAASRLSREGQLIFAKGPTPNGDRSLALLRLAHRCAEAGLAPEDCLLLMEDADLRWGKFLTRTGGAKELHKMIVKAYGMEPSPNT